MYVDFRIDSTRSFRLLNVNYMMHIRLGESSGIECGSSHSFIFLHRPFVCVCLSCKSVRKNLCIFSCCCYNEIGMYTITSKRFFILFFSFSCSFFDYYQLTNQCCYGCTIRKRKKKNCRNSKCYWLNRFLYS